MAIVIISNCIHIKEKLIISLIFPTVVAFIFSPDFSC